MPQFEVTTYPSQIFWLIMCFVFLCTIMARYLVPRLTATLESREQRLQQDWDQAKLVSSKEETLRQENLARLADARGKAHSLIHQALTEAHNSKSRRMTILDEELIVKTKKVREELETQTQKILGNIEPLVSQVVMATAPRILGQPLTRPQIKEVIQDILEKQGKT
jgi:F-type H+-transporting ATPase subunit b